MKVRWPELTEKHSEVRRGLRRLLLVGGGLGVYSFFSWRWFGAVPSLPRFFSLHSGFSWGFFMTFNFLHSFVLFYFLRLLNFLVFFVFFWGDGGYWKI